MSGSVQFVPTPDISDRTGHPPYRDVRLVRMSEGTAHGKVSWGEGTRLPPARAGLARKNPSALCNDLIVLLAVEIAARRPSLPVLIPAGCSIWQPTFRLLVEVKNIAIYRHCRTNIAALCLAGRTAGARTRRSVCGLGASAKGATVRRIRQLARDRRNGNEYTDIRRCIADADRKRSR
jgi:hypothetical protein